ncbi:hypothetical protein [Pedobacter aquatilis]|uniref:hypothetical protein n=1 Tax=Pedobacter aquatilis TaxID=351343 RepID=UPI00292EE0EA|nr:hypothetical protein [Pedobacter aquatilis]
METKTITQKRALFDQALIQEQLSERGERSYIIRNGLNVAEYALLAKELLEAEKLIAHDFTGLVKSEDGTREANFEYHSGWPLDGLAQGEVE